MRKYQQLLLIVISVASLGLLLVYRHEYNRLHYVLEVFNFFGQPCNFTGLIEYSKVSNHHDWGPEPTWTQDGNIFVYSTHRTSEQTVQSLIVKLPNLDHPRNCYLWYEDNEWKPEVGKFEYSSLFTGEEYAGYRYKCSWTKNAVPYAVSFSKKYLQKHLIVQKHNVSHTFNMTLCVPTSKFVTKRYMAEFLSFHALMGVDSYIIYSNALPHQTSKLITKFSSQLNFNISFYSYNFPIVFEEIISEDCYLRTNAQSVISNVMYINEYIVPENANLLAVLYSQTIHNKQLKLPIQTFCINEQLPKVPIAVQNLQSIRDEEKLTKVINVQSSNVILKTEQIRGLVSIHRYVFCLDHVTKTYEDKIILKYSDDFIKSTLFQLFVHNFL